MIIIFHSLDFQGETILKTLASAGHDRKIPIRIAQNKPNEVNNNTEYLAKYGKCIHAHVSKHIFMEEFHHKMCVQLHGNSYIVIHTVLSLRRGLI